MDLKTYLDIFRVKSALKITLAGIICILIINIFHMQSGYLSVLFVFLIMVLSHGRILKVGIQIVIALFLSAVVSLLVAYLFLDSKYLYLILMGLWIFSCMTFIGKYFLPTLLASILAAMSVFTAVFQSVSDTTHTVDHYFIQTVLAICVSWIVDDYIWPHRSKSALSVTLSSVFNDYAERLKSYSRRDSVAASPYESGTVSLNTVNNLVNLVKRADQESRGDDFPIDPYIRIVAFAKSAYIKLDLLEGYLGGKHRFLEDERVSDNLDTIFSALSERFEELGGAVYEDREPGDLKDDLDASLKSLHGIYTDMRSARGEGEDYFEDLMAFGALLPLLEDIVSLQKKTTDTFHLIQSGQFGKPKRERVTRTPEVETERKKNRVFITRGEAQQAMKTVIIIMLLLLGELFLHLPGGSQASFYGVLFGSMPNLGQAHLKGRFAILGVIIGLLYGLFGLHVISLVPHFPVMLLLFFLGFFLAGYLSSGKQTIAAAAFQVGLMMPYVLLIDTGPELNLSTAKMRFLALLMATSVGLLVLHNIWPVNPHEQLKKKISDAIRISGVIFGKLLKLDEKEKEKIDSLVTPLAASLPTSSSLLFDAQFVVNREKLHADEFVNIIDSIAVIYEELEVIKKTIYTNMDNELINMYLAHMAPDYKNIRVLFDRVSEQLETAEDVSGDIAALTDEIREHREEFRESGVSRKFGAEDIERNVLISTSVDGVLSSLHKISISINKISEEEVSEAVSLRTSRA